MEKITVTFLGTSDATPSTSRNHSAILISYGPENILVDCGEGTQRQFRIAKINPCKLTAIFLTHWHGDHMLGLPGLLQTLGMLGYNKTLQIRGPIGTKQNFNLIKELVPINIDYQIEEGTDKNFIEKKEWRIEAKKMEHTSPTNAYAFILKDKRRLDPKKIKKFKIPHSNLLKKLQQGQDIFYQNKKIKASQVSYIEKGKKIVIILDTLMNKNALLIAKNTDLLICEATFSKHEQQQAEKKKHMTATQAALLAKKAKVKHLILTHISQRYQANLKLIEEEAKNIFKNTKTAKDFDKIVI